MSTITESKKTESKITFTGSFNAGSYTITKSCTDGNLIDNLKKQGKLNPKTDYNLRCDAVNEYKIGGSLGKGGYNEVYDISNNPDKVLRLTLNTKSIKDKLSEEYQNLLTYLNDPTKMQEFMNNLMQNEITGLFLQSYLSKTTKEGGIECPFICKVYEFGYVTINEEKRAYAILERVTTDLNKHLARNTNNELINAKDGQIELFGKQTKVKFINVKNIFKQVLQGLQCMHANNYVHLDIKPENIGIMTIGNEKTVKIFDFGMAMYIDPTNSSPRYNNPFGKLFGFTPINATYQRGTPFYMDPFLNDKTDGKNFFPSKKSDVYSVGIMMLETYFSIDIDKHTGLLTSPVKIRMKHWEPFYRIYYDSNENKALIKPDANNNEHSPLKTLLKKMIDRNPENRCTVEEVLSDVWFKYDKEQNEEQNKEQKGGKQSRKFKKNRSRKTIKKRRQSSFVKSRRSSRR
jgi:serine/threonine protein kinase